jgi:hypothetical protein
MHEGSTRILDIGINLDWFWITFVTFFALFLFFLSFLFFHFVVETISNKFDWDIDKKFTATVIAFIFTFITFYFYVAPQSLEDYVLCRNRSYLETAVIKVICE